MTTKQRLAEAIREYNPDSHMVKLAEEGYYDDFESPLAAPQTQLLRDLREAGMLDLHKRARNGEFDGTREEAEAWFQREGRHLLNSI